MPTLPNALLPVRAKRRNWPIPRQRAQRSKHAFTRCATVSVCGHGALGDVPGDAPVVGVDPLYVAGPAQGLQAADVRADKRVRILTLLLEDFADALDMSAWLVEAAIVLRHDGDVAIRCSWEIAWHLGRGR